MYLMARNDMPTVLLMNDSRHGLHEGLMAFHHMHMMVQMFELLLILFPELKIETDSIADSSARCVFRGGQGSSTINGTIDFRQMTNVVRLTGEISGLNPGNHGFHIHTVGVIDNNCEAAGGHYNPLNRNHGNLNTFVRHLGDLGNIFANINGVATVNIQTRGISLSGTTSVIGRALVIHANQDDLGVGSDLQSKAAGNSGARIGCCLIFRES